MSGGVRRNLGDGDGGAGEAGWLTSKLLQRWASKLGQIVYKHNSCASWKKKSNFPQPVVLTVPHPPSVLLVLMAPYPVLAVGRTGTNKAPENSLTLGTTPERAMKSGIRSSQKHFKAVAGGEGLTGDCLGLVCGLCATPPPSTPSNPWGRAP